MKRTAFVLMLTDINWAQRIGRARTVRCQKPKQLHHMSPPHQCISKQLLTSLTFHNREEEREVLKINLTSTISMPRKAVRHMKAIYSYNCDAPETSLVKPECVTEEEQVDSEKHNLSASPLPHCAHCLCFGARCLSGSLSCCSHRIDGKHIWGQ